MEQENKSLPKILFEYSADDPNTLKKVTLRPPFVDSEFLTGLVRSHLPLLKSPFPNHLPYRQAGLVARSQSSISVDFQHRDPVEYPPHFINETLLTPKDQEDFIHDVFIEDINLIAEVIIERDLDEFTFS